MTTPRFKPGDIAVLKKEPDTEWIVEGYMFDEPRDAGNDPLTDQEKLDEGGWFEGYKLRRMTKRGKPSKAKNSTRNVHQDAVTGPGVPPIPQPSCCADMKAYPLVFFTVDPIGTTTADSLYPKPTWRGKYAFKEYGRERPWGRGEVSPNPKFCPYCATPLPLVRKREVLVEPIMRCSDGGYYCDTCHERLNCCTCNDYRTAWEVVPPETDQGGPKLPNFKPGDIVVLKRAPETQLVIECYLFFENMIADGREELSEEQKLEEGLFGGYELRLPKETRACMAACEDEIQRLDQGGPDDA